MTFRMTLVVLSLAIAGSPLFAKHPYYNPSRSPRPVPLLMPPPAVAATPDTRVAAVKPYRSASSVDGSSTAEKKTSKISAMGIGFEIGTMGRANKTQSDLAGLQLFWGGRFFTRMAVTEDIFVTPSLGYFQKRESQGSAGVTQHILEAGAGAYYAVWTGRKARFLAGAVGRAEYGIAQLSALNSDSSSAGEFRFRAGPAASLAVGMSPEFSFVLDVEAGIAFGKDTRIQPGLAAGLIYYLP